MLDLALLWVAGSVVALFTVFRPQLVDSRGYWPFFVKHRWAPLPRKNRRLAVAIALALALLYIELWPLLAIPSARRRLFRIGVRLARLN
jgi:hypothetical protein